MSNPESADVTLSREDLGYVLVALADLARDYASREQLALDAGRPDLAKAWPVQAEKVRELHTRIRIQFMTGQVPPSHEDVTP